MVYKFIHFKNASLADIKFTTKDRSGFDLSFISVKAGHNFGFYRY